MTRPITHRPLVLGLHLTARGFGWAVFENPLQIHSFGVHNARGDKNRSCLRKLVWLLERLEPEVLVIEAFGRDFLRSERVRRLCLDVVAAATEHGAEFAVFERAEVERCFAAAGARSRQEIAEAVARSVPALRPYLPPGRRQWDCEARRLSIFAAAALALTHYHNGATALLDDLRNAA